MPRPERGLAEIVRLDVGSKHNREASAYEDLNRFASRDAMCSCLLFIELWRWGTAMSHVASLLFGAFS